MMEHLPSTFDRELAELKDNVLKMGVMVKELIHKSVEALKNQDKDLAKEVIKHDVEVDKLELEIDQKGINVIALRQPKANDLRFVITAMRIATDLERIGDLAEDIAERAIETADKPVLKPLIDIPEMAKLCKESIDIVLDAFINSDSEKARSVWVNERKVDNYRDAVHEEIEEIMSKNPADIDRALPLLLVSRHLERISDHTTNIAEDVVYMVEAKVVKHPASNKENNK
jgi:phosphate transport system protein